FWAEGRAARMTAAYISSPSNPKARPTSQAITGMPTILMAVAVMALGRSARDDNTLVDGRDAPKLMRINGIDAPPRITVGSMMAAGTSTRVRLTISPAMDANTTGLS